MRTDQWIGLNERSEKFLMEKFGRDFTLEQKMYWSLPEDPQSKPEVTTRSGRSIPHWYIIETDPVGGAFGDYAAGYLRTYKDDSGYIIREKLQATPWSSGPCYFVALQDEEGNFIEDLMWTEAEIDEQI